MKHDVRKQRVKKQRGAIVMIALVIMMILAAYSAVMLKQFAREHEQYNKRVSDIQVELYRDAISHDDFLKLFDGQTQVLTATLDEPGPSPSTRYVFRVDPATKPVSASLQLQKIPRRINHHDN